MANDIINKNDIKANIETPDIDPIVQMLGATVAAKSTEAFLQRTYLENITACQENSTAFIKVKEDMIYGGGIHWVRIHQIGKPVDNGSDASIDMLQRILQYVHKPGMVRLLYLIVSDGDTNYIYLGIRSLNGKLEQDLGDSIGQFIKSNWNGMACTVCDEKRDTGLQLYREMLKEDRNTGRSRTPKLEAAYALSGLPASIQNGKDYSATIDKLLNGMAGTPFAYIVVADPVYSSEVNDMLFQYRELSGKAESFKTVNYTEGFQEGLSRSLAESLSEFRAEAQTSGISKRSKSGNAMAAASAGLSLVTTVATAASMIFPPAILVAGGGMLASSVLSVVQGACSQESKSISKTDSRGKTETYNVGVSQNVNRTLAKTLVNKHIASLTESLEYQIKRFTQSLAYGCWDTRCFLLTPTETETERAALQMRSLLSGENSGNEPVRIHSLCHADKNDAKAIREGLLHLQPPLLSIVNQDGQYIQHPLGEHYEHINLPVNTRELAMLINFPLSPVPGIDVIETCNEYATSKRRLEDSCKPFEQRKILNIGELMFGGSETNLEFSIDIDELTKHALICGINGSGKSTTCRKILEGLLKFGKEKNNKGVPFLVIEPAKDEYVEWAIQHNSACSEEEKINIWMPGASHWRDGMPLEGDFFLNPFDILVYEKSGPAVLEHIDRLKTIINASLPMQEILPVLMEELLYRVYDVPIYSKSQKTYVKWLPSNGFRAANQYDRKPSFLQAKAHVRKMIADKGYHERISMDLSAALMTRLDSFCRGWRKKLFNYDQTTYEQWHSLFTKPTVINLTKLASDEDKAFVMALLISFLYEYRQMEQMVNGDTLLKVPELKHLLVVEEAHRVLSGEQVFTSSGNARAKLAEMFSNLLSEVRAYGQGILMADQVPTRLIPDAIKNTNLKLVHRLVADDDKAAVGGCMNLSETQKKILGKLKQGQMVACGNNDDIAYWVKVRKS